MISFLFSDIEDSTRRWDQFPLAMAVARHEHAEILTTAIEASAGRLVKDTGDGVFASFTNQQHALDCAISAQRALLQHDWQELGDLPVRMGLHSGYANESDSGDFHGVVVNEAARIMDAGHGGQILASAQFAASITDRSVGATSLGHHRLKGLRETVEIVQLVGEGLPTTFPALRTPDGMPNNLPLQATAFFGRESELDELRQLIETNRLITLVGAGGSGKTRLALELAHHAISASPGGVWFIDLARVDDPRMVPEAAASALRLLDRVGYSWSESVLNYLADRKTFLVFDNCEHVIDAAAELINNIITECPDVGVVGTSREPIGVMGEVTWPVRSLAVPAADAAPDQVAESEAVRFFIERMRAADPKLSVDNVDPHAASNICRRLDGLPLALELAASRIRSMPLTEIAKHLDDRFRLLVGGTRTALPRQRTLEATVSWSYDLLDPDEQLAFRELSVFAGSFSLEAAVQISPIATWDVVTRLVEKSLIELGPPPHGRYRMLETLRAFGRPLLIESGEMSTCRDRQLVWASELAELARTELNGEDQGAWLTLIENELVNIRAALDWALDTRETADGLAIASNLFRYWFSQRIAEGQDWLERLLDAHESSDSRDPIRAAANLSIAPLLQAQGEYTAGFEAATAARDVFDALDDRSNAAYSTYYRARCLMGLDQLSDAYDDLLTTTAEFRAMEDRFGEMVSMTVEVLLGAQLGRYDDAESARLLAELEALGDVGASPTMLAHIDETIWLVNAYHGRLEGERARLASALKVFQDIDNRMCIMHCLVSIVHCTLHLPSAEDGVRLYGKVGSMRDDAGIVVPPWERIFTDRIGEALRTEWSASETERLMDEGAELTLEEAITLGIEVTSR